MKICIPLRAGSTKEVEKMWSRALRVRKELLKKGFVDEVLFEMWLDKVTPQEVQNLFKKVPTIAVCRAKIEGGSFKGREEERIERLEEGIKSGAQFVDVGIQTAPKFIKKIKQLCAAHKAKLIISEHIWKNTPPISVLIKKAAEAQRKGADIVKIATTAKSFSDNSTLFELTTQLINKGKKAIVIGMGEKGKVSRIGCPLLGSFLTYVSLDEKTKTAPGQITVNELLTFML